MPRPANAQPQRNNVIELKPEYKYDPDPVFFHKGQLQPGVELINYGRRDPRSRWRVTQIQTFKKLASGNYRLVPTDIVEHLSDIIHLRRDGGELRRATFAALSYSAIWRLP